MTTTIIGVCIAAFAGSSILTRMAIGLAHRHGAMESPGPQKIHRKETPNLGWVGIFGGWLIPLICMGLVVLWYRVAGTSEDPLLEGMLRKMPAMAGIVFLGLTSVLFGWLDDRKKLSVGAKILGQVALALLLCALGIRISLFVPNAFFGVALTVLWVLCVMNAINLLDNLDGCCAGVTVIGCGLFLIVALWLHQYFIALLLASFLGALAGFLIFNFPPARIFMGNAGSSFVGFLLATLTILETFYTRAVPSHLAVIMPVLILAVPIYDTASVICLRLAQGVPITRGDLNHFSHRLLGRGWTARQAVLLIYAITATIGLGSLCLPFVDTSTAVKILAACALFFVLLGIWEKWGQTPF